VRVRDKGPALACLSLASVRSEILHSFSLVRQTGYVQSLARAESTIGGEAVKIQLYTSSRARAFYTAQYTKKFIAISRRRLEKEKAARKGVSCYLEAPKPRKESVSKEMASREALISLQTGPKGEHIESETGEVTTEEVITIISPRLQPQP
jgi:hypothetical protein